VCGECGCTTGGALFCYEHKPYMVYPKADGSFLVDRYGRRHVSFDEPPTPAHPLTDEELEDAALAMLDYWRWGFNGRHTIAAKLRAMKGK
jgi:hypothetical protein